MGMEPRPVQARLPKVKTNKLWEEWEKDQLLQACRKYGTKVSLIFILVSKISMFNKLREEFNPKVIEMKLGAQYKRNTSTGTGTK
jgi:hypothetical protein